MNNELQIFTDETFGDIPSAPSPEKDCGVVYFIEINDKVKIGSSHNPSERLRILISNAQKYFNAKIGRIAISQYHNGYRVAERNMHKYLEDCRIEGTELFDVDFSTATACFANRKEITLTRHDDSKALRVIRRAVENVNNTSLVEYAADKVKHILNSPLCYWCIVNVPEIGEESYFVSYEEIRVYLEILCESYESYKNFTENINTPDKIREHLILHMLDLLRWFSVSVQVDAIDEDGTAGVRLMSSGRFNEEQQNIVDDIVLNFIPLIESDNATA